MNYEVKTIGNKIIFEGCSDNIESCNSITQICNALKEDKKFKCIEYRDGYAEFECLEEAEEKKFPSCDFYIYSNDGTTLIKTEKVTIRLSDSFEVTSTGLKIYGASDTIYTYSGPGKFLGFAETPNKSTPDFPIGTVTKITVFSMALYIVEDLTPKAVNANDLDIVKTYIDNGLESKANVSHTQPASSITGLATVATTGSYNDLSNKPTIPTVYDSTIIIQSAGTEAGRFSLNQASGQTINIPTPTLNYATDQEVEDILNPQVKLPVGGRIFYIHNDNGATYKFYDGDNNELTTQTVEGLANAVSYTVEGTPSADKFYVVYPDQGTATYYWGYYEITTGATDDYIGSGKLNTKKIMAIEDDSGFYQGSIWEYIADMNKETGTNGCADWFIGSEAEYDKLRATSYSPVSFASEYVWSSVEANSYYACLWAFRFSEWEYGSKSGSYCCVPVRSF